MLREIAVGVLVGLCVLGPLCLACGNSALVQCKLEALKVLPEDPGMVTLYDAVDIVERVRACHRSEADGGQ